jgi:hypothetical protein
MDLLDGTAAVPEALLETVFAFLEWDTRVSVEALQVAVQLRNTTWTGPAPVLEPDPAALQVECSTTGFACTVDSDCPGVMFGEFCGAFMDLPASYFCDSVTFPGVGDGTCDNACASGGACELANPDRGLTQCSWNGFCLFGDLEVPLEGRTGDTFVTPASGQVLFGFYDDGESYPINTDGTYALPSGAPQISPLPPLGMHVFGLFNTFALECIMAVDSNGPDGVGVPDQASPTPDSALIPFNVQVP